MPDAPGHRRRAEDFAASESGSWHLVSTHYVTVAEPSGLCLALDGRSLYTVSDEIGLVHQLGMDGRTLGFLPFTGEDFARNGRLELHR